MRHHQLEPPLRHPTERPVASSPEAARRTRAVGKRDTAAEMAVRQVLTALGARYRLCVAELPGRPDVVNLRRGWCVQVHGCLWHGHEGCARAARPRANADFWNAKIDYNRARDRRNLASLRELGFRVAVVWECQLRDLARLKRRLRRFLGGAALRPPG